MLLRAWRLRTALLLTLLARRTLRRSPIAQLPLQRPLLQQSVLHCLLVLRMTGPDAIEESRRPARSLLLTWLLRLLLLLIGHAPDVVGDDGADEALAHGRAHRTDLVGGEVLPLCGGQKERLLLLRCKRLVPELALWRRRDAIDALTRSTLLLLVLELKLQSRLLLVLMRCLLLLLRWNSLLSGGAVCHDDAGEARARSSIMSSGRW